MTHGALVLACFYKDYLEWVETGVSIHPFMSNTGLCANLCAYIKTTDQMSREAKNDVFALLIEDIQKLDVDSTLYPFGGMYVYGTEMNAGTVHLNPDRIAFVKSKVQQN